MPIKDYYELLEIPPGSPEPLIRKAFRKLAMRYHPDKNIGNPYASHHFREIKEAYEVLSNPVSRSEYHQKRWRHSDPGAPHFTKYQVTPAMIEKEAHKIERYVKTLDVFRMNYDALYNQLEQLLNPGHLALLMEERSEKINEKIIGSVLQSCQPLPYPYLNDIPGKLVQLAGTNNRLLVAIHHLVSKKRNQYLWDKYKAIIMILIALTICIIIYTIA